MAYFVPFFCYLIVTAVHLQTHFSFCYMGQNFTLIFDQAGVQCCPWLFEVSHSTSVADSDFHGHRPAVYINQHLFWGLMSVDFGTLTEYSVPAHMLSGLVCVDRSRLVGALNESSIGLVCLDKPSIWAEMHG